MVSIWDNYWRNAWITIVIIISCIMMIHFTIADYKNEPIIYASIWVFVGSIPNALLLIKKWYQGHPFTLEDIVLWIALSTIFGPLLISFIYQFGLKIIFDIYNNRSPSYIIFYGRKSARTLRILSK